MIIQPGGGKPRSRSSVADQRSARRSTDLGVSRGPNAQGEDRSATRRRFYSLWDLEHQGPSVRAASVSGFFNFDQVAGVNIIKIPINRYLARNERVLANAAHVIDHSRLFSKFGS